MRLLIALALATVVPLWLWAEPPAWWVEREVIDPAATADDYAVVNQGQVKHIAKQAYEEMEEKLPGGAGTVLVGLWASPAAGTDDYRAINIGQLKNVAKPFYDRLIVAEIVSDYPWGEGTDDYAVANIGQVKNLFSFVIPKGEGDGDGDGDGLSDEYEIAMGLDPLMADADSDLDGDSVINREDARPNNAGVGRLTISIAFPANGAVYP